MGRTYIPCFDGLKKAWYSESWGMHTDVESISKGVRTAIGGSGTGRTSQISSFPSSSPHSPCCSGPCGATWSSDSASYSPATFACRRSIGENGRKPHRALSGGGRVSNGPFYVLGYGNDIQRRQNTIHNEQTLRIISHYRASMLAPFVFHLRGHFGNNRLSCCGKKALVLTDDKYS